MNTNTSTDRKLNILVVDDSVSSGKMLSMMLEDAGYNVRHALEGTIALEIANSGWPNIILLDIVMPIMDGYEICQKIKSNHNVAEIPIIFLSSLNDIFDIKKAFNVGGVDYISKPFQIEEVLVRIENHLTIESSKAAIHQLNLELQQRSKELAITNQKLQQEIVQRQKAQDSLLRNALRDPLTGFANRNAFVGRVNKIIQQIQQQSESKSLFCILLLECGCFSKVKHDYGYLKVQKLLLAIGNLLVSYLPKHSLLSRFEGDEFAIVLDQVKNVREATELAQTIQDKLQEFFVIDEEEIVVKNSIGLVVYDEKYQNVDTLLHNANIALQEAKMQGYYQVFQPELLTATQKVNSNLLDLKSSFDQGLTKGQFVVYYQPVVSLAAGDIIELEALICWNHPTRGLINSEEFIPLASEIGFIIPLGDFLMREACQQIQALQQTSKKKLPFRISLNFSSQQFSQPSLLKKIDRTIEETEINSSNLKLEIPEKAIAENPEFTIDFLHDLQARNIHLGVKDFGENYSSLTYLALSYLTSFPIDSIKIDACFINQLYEHNDLTMLDRSPITMFEQLNNLARQMNTKVISKNVNNHSQLQYLTSLKCSYGQGDILSQKLDKQALEELLLWTTY